MIVEYNGKIPDVQEAAFVAETAVVAGDVQIGKDSSIWFSAVLRADEAPIRIGARCSIQDNATVHCDAGMPVTIGDDVTVGHNAIIHSCTIGSGTVIGMGAVILNQAEIGEGCMIAAGAVVTGKTVVPPHTMAAGTPASVKKELSSEAVRKNLENAEEYVRLALQYNKAGR